MKVTRKDDQAFKPVTIELTFETEREYKLFKQFIGNHSAQDWTDKANSSGLIHDIDDFKAEEANDISNKIYRAL